MAEWISVKDKLPTQCEDVLTYSEIPDEEAEKFQTVSDLVNYVEANVE